MKTAGQFEGQFCTCLCQDSSRTGHTQTRAGIGFTAGQAARQTQDCPDFCPLSLLGRGQKDKREQITPTTTTRGFDKQ